MYSLVFLFGCISALCLYGFFYTWTYYRQAEPQEKKQWMKSMLLRLFVTVGTASAAYFFYTV